MSMQKKGNLLFDKSYGCTPLHFFIKYKRQNDENMGKYDNADFVNSLSILINAGADISITNE